MPTYFRFGVGPFRFSQRLGRTQAQKRAAAKARAQRQNARAQRQYAEQQAREKADRDRRSFDGVPAHDVTHGEGGYTSFVLEPPGFPQLVIKLENGHFSTESSLLTEDFTWLREGDRVSGTISPDTRSLEWLRGSLVDRMRYIYAGLGRRHHQAS
jgi:ATPase subunit of ABC transporter with duplicated ATPase domains